MTTIVFSKDRAMQLHAFLRSYQHHVAPAERVTVLYRATTPAHADAYEEMLCDRACIDPVRENEFRPTLLDLLPHDGTLTFFVDDQIFIRDWTPIEEPGLSLRLGTHIVRNYASGDQPQALPIFEQLPDGRLRWLWREGSIAWGYPLSLDGHVYDARQMRHWIERVDFHSPNTLESALQAFADRCEWGSCYPEARVVNVPWNLTQTDWHNRHAAALTTEEMLDWWAAGYQIALHEIDGVLNESVHQEFPLTFEKRR